MPLGAVVPTKRVFEEFVTKFGFTSSAVQGAIQIMISRNELASLNQQKTLKRIR